MNEKKLTPMIQRELNRIRVAHPDVETVRRKYREADHAYRKADHAYRKAVGDGDGSTVSGDVIAHYYIIRQAYVLYAIDENISLKVG